ncbi:MAG: SoxR reducing system RseC family protein [Bacteroidales bacterium]|nr:SoxR reducing system RseC family protein [Bacteroidales bacterium]
MSKTVSHKGVVVAVDGRRLKVQIESVSACAACHAKGMCTLSDKEEKLIDIEMPNGMEKKVGDVVTVVVTQQRGMQAVVLAYILPAIVVILSLVGLLNIVSEPAAIILSLLSLAVYYILLYLFRNRISSKFVMTLAEC